jgi:DNA repair protein RecO (recombination protein O)
VLHTRGIVFRTVKYGETSIIVDIYTEEKGLQSFIAGNVRSAKSQMSFSLFQPMQVLEIVSYYREGDQVLHRLKEARMSQYFDHIPFDVKRGAVVLFMAEVLRKCIREAQADSGLFHFLIDTLTFLDTPEAPLAVMPAWFLAQLTDWFGFMPSEDEIPADGQLAYFDLRDGALVLTPDPLSDQLAPDLAQCLFSLLKTDTSRLAQLQLTASQRKALLNGLLKYYAYHIDKFGQVNAHEVLNTVFHG